MKSKKQLIKKLDSLADEPTKTFHSVHNAVLHLDELKEPLQKMKSKKRDEKLMQILCDARGLMTIENVYDHFMKRVRALIPKKCATCGKGCHAIYVMRKRMGGW